jgi:CRISPR-associated protein Cas2
MGWLLVAFDLPVMTDLQRKQAAKFRKFLLDDGYQMIQFSVYARSCVTYPRQQTHLRRVKSNLPPEGKVRAIFITRAQWEKAFIMHGSPGREVPPEDLPEQMQFW